MIGEMGVWSQGKKDGKEKEQDKRVRKVKKREERIEIKKSNIKKRRV